MLMGGKNIEREVSFNSGRTVCDHLDTARYEVIPIFQRIDGALFILPWYFLHRGKIADFEHRLAAQAQEIIWDQLPALVDFIYNALPGRFSEDGCLQGVLEILGIPYLGSSIFPSALCMDKIMVKQILAHHGIHVPRGFHLTVQEVTNYNEKQILAQITKHQLDYPLVVKPHAEGSSLGITVVKNHKQLKKAIEHACFISPHKSQSVIIEEKLIGMEFSCITIVDYRKGTLLPLPPTEIEIEAGSEIFDYEQKYMPGRAHKFTPPRCSDEIIKQIQETCKKAMEALEIQTISRIDGFVTKDGRIVIVEPNTLTGMAPSSFLFREAAEINISHTDLINHLIETDLHRYGILQKIEHQEAKQNKTMNEKKLRIAVLMGGPSHEREISLESGRNVVYKLSPHRYEVSAIFVAKDMKLYHINQAQLVRNSTSEIASVLKETDQITWHSLKQNYDFVFIGLHGGPGENGTVQGMLEMLGIPYNGSSVLASAICMDKYRTAFFLKAAGFEVPNQLLVNKKEWTTAQIKYLKQVSYPCIVKPHDDGCSVMVHKAYNEEQLIDIVDSIFKTEKTHILIEEFLTGMELTVGVVGNEAPRALPPSQAISTKDVLSIEEKFLPGAGENQTPAPLPPETLALVQRTMEGAYAAVGCKGYARIDCFYQSADISPTGQERIVTLEINSLPGLTPATCIFHQAAEIGLKPMDFIDLIVQYGLQEHSYKENLVDTSPDVSNKKLKEKSLNH